MPEPDRTSNYRQLVVGLVVIAIAALAAVFLFQRARTPRAPPPAPVPAAPAKPVAAAPLPPPALSRADLIAASRAAAAAHADGAPAGQAELVGRAFKIAIPFACKGPGADGVSAWASWSYGAGDKSIRIRAKSEDWTQSAFARDLGGPEAFEAIEGFWAPRPWAASDGCPSRKPDPLEAAPPPSPQTVGLVILHEKGASRVGRRGDRPYELVIKRPDDGAPFAPKGLHLVLSGRVVGFPGGAAIRCRSASLELRPVCLTSVRIEHVALLDPSTGETLGDWDG